MSNHACSTSLWMAGMQIVVRAVLAVLDAKWWVGLLSGEWWVGQDAEW